MSKNKYYAYFIESENNKGITDTWDKCKEIIAGKKARYKGFKNQNEAKEWLSGGAKYEDKKSVKQSLKQNLQKGIYFDAGTGRGIGVEVKVTDEKGNNLLNKVIQKEKINEFGNYHLQNVTNNYGELLGCFLALKLALEVNEKNIYGDSKLIIDYWSKGFIKRDKLPADTVKLSEQVTKLRIQFERNGGKIEHVSGDVNPADLGFHK